MLFISASYDYSVGKSLLYIYADLLSILYVLDRRDMLRQKQAEYVI